MLTLSAPLMRRRRPMFHYNLLRGVGLGAEESATDVLVPVLTPTAIFWSLLATAAAGASAYHGYKRNDSIGWAVVWGLLGGIAPVITVPVALAQGFGRRHH